MKIYGTEKIECKVGTYQDEINKTSCKPASKGYYVSTTNSVNQTPCEVGSYQNLEKQTKCIKAAMDIL